MTERELFDIGTWAVMATGVFLGATALGWAAANINYNLSRKRVWWREKRWTWRVWVMGVFCFFLGSFISYVLIEWLGYDTNVKIAALEDALKVKDALIAELMRNRGGK